VPLSGLMGEDCPPIDAAEYARRLRSILDALPTGVVLAEAPSGRIVYGNGAIGTMFGRPENLFNGESTPLHEDGSRVERHEYPLARVIAGEERPELECSYHRRDGSTLWVKIIGVALRNREGEVGGVALSVTDIDALKASQMQYVRMKRELHHRVNNALAMIQSITNLSARTRADAATFNEIFSGRVRLMSRAQVLLGRNSWEHIPLRELLATAIDGSGGQIALSGENAFLRSEVALALALAIHELKTNAERFGALSKPGGAVRLGWSSFGNPADHKLRLEWRESGGPMVSEPGRFGLGLNLLTKILPPQIGGPVDVKFEPSGLEAAFVVGA
jgi:PAS domain S-box-containing protein